MAVASIVHQHIGRAVAGLDFSHCAVDALEIGDIQQHAMSVGWVELFEGLQVRLGAHGTDDAMAGAEGFPGEGMAEAAADASDEEGFGGMALDLGRGLGHGRGGVGNMPDWVGGLPVSITGG